MDSLKAKRVQEEQQSSVLSGEHLRTHVETLVAALNDFDISVKMFCLERLTEMQNLELPLFDFVVLRVLVPHGLLADLEPVDLKEREDLVETHEVSQVNQLMKLVLAFLLGLDDLRQMLHLVLVQNALAQLVIEELSEKVGVD